MLDATRLRVLVAIARHGSVTAAAQALNYAQPSISHHMARLESETGAKLMERSGRGIRLTDAGWLLAERAEEILGRLDAAEAELAAHVGLKQETVRLAAFGSALSTLAAAASSALRADRASADISLVQAEPADALRMLRIGEVDVALVFRYRHDADPHDAAAGTPPPGAQRSSGQRPGARVAGEDDSPDDDLRYLPVLDEPVFLIAPTAGPAETGTPAGAGRSGKPGRAGPGQRDTGGYRAQQPARTSAADAKPQAPGTSTSSPGTSTSAPNASRSAPNASTSAPGTGTSAPGASAAARCASLLAEYAGHRWIAGCERCQDILIRLCRSAGFSPDIAVTTDDYIAAQALVAAGLGTAVLPGLALRALRHPGITATELPGTRRQVLAVTYGGPPERLATSALLTALTRVAAEFGSPP